MASFFRKAGGAYLAVAFTYFYTIFAKPDLNWLNFDRFLDKKSTTNFVFSSHPERQSDAKDLGLESFPSYRKSFTKSKSQEGEGIEMKTHVQTHIKKSSTKKDSTKKDSSKKSSSIDNPMFAVAASSDETSFKNEEDDFLHPPPYSGLYYQEKLALFSRDPLVI